MVYQLLSRCPVHMPEVGLGYGRLGFTSCTRSVQIHSQLDVVGRVVLLFQVRQRLRICLLAGRSFADEGLQSIGAHHPRRDRRGEVLGAERAKGNIFPGLDVPGRPVVHHDIAEDVLLSLFHRQWPSKRRQRSTKEEANFKLKVQELARPIAGAFPGIFSVFLKLAPRPCYRGARNDNAGRPAVVAHWEVQPVRLQGVVLPSKHDSHIRGMLSGGIEICVVANLRRQMHLHVLEGQQRRFAQCRRIPESGVAVRPGGEEVGETLPR
mmetsp:Transcript_62001/g.145418  ORF Transcript_62001/g.145418 Transcript_62001/m.145418 type:complete len:266 (-) Transcript_62001:346-1143(-)